MASELRARTGKVTRISQREKSYGVLIDDVWYNGIGICPVKAEQEISMEFTKQEYNGKPVLTIKEIKLVNLAKTKAETAQKPKPTKELTSLDEIIEEAKTIADKFVVGGQTKNENSASLNRFREVVFVELMKDRRTILINRQRGAI